MAEVRIPEAKDEAGDGAQARWCRAVKSGRRVYVVMAATDGSTWGSGAATGHRWVPEHSDHSREKKGRARGRQRGMRAVAVVPPPV